MTHNNEASDQLHRISGELSTLAETLQPIGAGSGDPLSKRRLQASAETVNALLKGMIQRIAPGPRYLCDVNMRLALIKVFSELQSAALKADAGLDLYAPWPWELAGLTTTAVM